MEELLIGNDAAVITLLLLFITGILTKRIVPWWVHDDALEKLKAYEDAAPKLITEIQHLMDVLHEQDAELDEQRQRLVPERKRLPRVKQQGRRLHD